VRAFRVTPPRADPDAITRPRLLRSLHRRFDVPVVTVVGPAGYGKTTLLAQAIHENRLAPAGIDRWLRCEPEDADAAHLAAGLAAALGIEPPAPPFVDSLRDALWSRSPQPVAVLLDDVHELDPDTPGAELLEELTGALPANAHLVLAGRTDPPVRLGRRTASGEVATVAAADLLLDDTELALVAARAGVDTDVFGHTGGWPALVALARSAGPVAGARYVWEEVAAGLPASARDALAALVCLGGGDDAAVSAALGRAVCLAAELGSVPLMAHDDDGWWEAHALWVPVLGGHFEPSAAAGMRREAAAMLHDRGRWNRAAALLFTADGAGDSPLDDTSWSTLAAIITAGCRVNASLTGDVPLAAWSRRLPVERREEPEGLLLRATVARRAGAALDEAETLLQQAWAAARAAGRLDAETSAMSQLGHVAWWRDDVATMTAIMRRAQERAEAGVPLDPSLMALAGAIVADIRGDDSAMLDALAGIDDGSDRDTLAAAEWFRARALVGLGRSEDAIRHADRAAATADAAFQSARLSMVSARWYAGRPVEAMRYVERAAPGPGALSRDQFLASLLFAVGHAHLGDLAAAHAHLAGARAHVKAVEGSRPALYLTAVTAVLAFAAGDDAEAARLAAGAVAELDALGLEQGLRVLRPLLTAMYVLYPGVRDPWDQATLGPDRIAARDVARAFLEARAGEPAVALPDPGTVLANLPLRAATELAARRSDPMLARWLLDACTLRARDELRGHAASGDAALARGARDLLRVLPTPPAEAVCIRMLGPSTIERDGEPSTHPDWRRERVRSLLAFLVVRRTTTREAAVAALWPDLDAAAGAQNLRRTLNYLHGVLEPDRQPGDAPWFVRSDGDTLRVVADSLSVDAWELDSLLDRAAAADAAGTPSEALGALDEALALWRGAFLADLFDEWTTAERDRLRARFLAASVRAGELRLGIGDIDRALAIAARALDAEPWSEAAHRLAIAAHLARGDRASARRAYDRCAAALGELGVDPDPATEMLARTIRRRAGES
jgi:DNA-binding SARP family transcriptional activator